MSQAGNKGAVVVAEFAATLLRAVAGVICEEHLVVIDAFEIVS